MQLLESINSGQLFIKKLRLQVVPFLLLLLGKILLKGKKINLIGLFMLRKHKKEEEEGIKIKWLQKMFKKKKKLDSG
jgi:hypothetical protein